MRCLSSNVALVCGPICDSARSGAANADKAINDGRPLGRLHGVLIAVKDPLRHQRRSYDFRLRGICRLDSRL